MSPKPPPDAPEEPIGDNEEPQDDGDYDPDGAGDPIGEPDDAA